MCHPNYATYLINRQTLTMQDIEKIIQSIPPKHKVLYDQKLIKQLYDQFQSRQIDDSAAVAESPDWSRGENHAPGAGEKSDQPV